MMKPTFLALLFLAILISCKDKNDDDLTLGSNNQVVNYFPLTVGSYWVYDWVRVDTLGVEHPFGNRDSIYISGDTIINGIEYAIVETSLFGDERTQEYHRDSSGFLINHNGEILFDPINSTDLLWIDTIFAGSDPYVLIEYSMEGTMTNIEVPSGMFDCLNLQGKMIPQQNNYPWGTRYKRDYYADGVGKVQSKIFFYLSPDDLFSKLVSYHIE